MRDAIILIFANKQDLPEGKAFLHGGSLGTNIVKIRGLYSSLLQDVLEAPAQS